MSPRWSKVLRDLTRNRAQTLLVLMSIGVGLFALGLVISTSAILSRELPQSYLNANPSTAILFTEPCDDQALDTVRSVPEVALVTGRRTLEVRALVGPGVWHSLQLVAVNDFHEMHVDIVTPVSGSWPPPKGTFVIERASRGVVPSSQGDTMLVETSGHKQRKLAVSGVAHDMLPVPATLGGPTRGFISYDTLEWLVGSRGYTELHLVLKPSLRTRSAIEAATDQIRKRVENNGVRVTGLWIPPSPDKPPTDAMFQTLVGMLQRLGLLALLLSFLLIINIISALVTYQTRQIGVMKAIGASSHQIIQMYGSMVVLLGLGALLLALPVIILCAAALSSFVAGFMNYNIRNFQLPSRIYLILTLIGLLVPLLVALIPILAGVRVTVREAITAVGMAGRTFGTSRIDRVVQRIHFLPRPALISLRNTVRRKSRLVITVLTLTVAGGTFVATMSVRTSTLLTFERTASYWNYDAEISLLQPYRGALIRQTVLQTPGVVRVETWLRHDVRRERPDGHESNTMPLIGPTAGTAMIRPRVLQGRWLLPEDRNALVLNTDVLKYEPDIRVGDMITLVIDQRKTSWRVVGVISSQLSGAALYANGPSVALQARAVGMSNLVVVQTREHDAAFRRRVIQALEQQLRQQRLYAGQILAAGELFGALQSQFDVVVIFLVTMALFQGIVGGLGLTGTMSLNVLERTREIGIMRAIGASNDSIFKIVLLEGACIGLVSWALSGVVAIPIAWRLNNVLGMTLLQNALDFRFSFNGLALWLVLVLVLSVMASSLPAHRATTLQVHTVLTYE
jgi:putative ABC transport system permease protein